MDFVISENTLSTVTSRDGRKQRCVAAPGDGGHAMMLQREDTS